MIGRAATAPRGAGEHGAATARFGGSFSTPAYKTSVALATTGHCEGFSPPWVRKAASIGAVFSIATFRTAYAWTFRKIRQNWKIFYVVISQMTRRGSRRFSRRFLRSIAISTPASPKAEA